MITITNAIPVVFRHFKHLNTAIDNILTQTILPNEIIIIISEYVDNNDNNLILSNIEDKVKKYNINFIVDTFVNKQYAGQNRQIAYNLCNSNIIIFQDCDDLAHKQRNEILLKIYEKTKSPHILHGWTNDKNSLNKYIDINQIKIHNKDKINKMITTNGPVFLNKTDIGEIIFPNNIKGQDVALNTLLKNKFNSILIQNNDIYIYNNNLSSWK